MASSKVDLFPDAYSDTPPVATTTATGSSKSALFPDAYAGESDPLPPEVAKRVDKNAASLAVQASPIVGIPVPDIYKKANTVAKAMYGPFENPGSASAKLGDAINDVPVNEKLAELWGAQMRDGETPERAAQIAEREKQKKSSGKGVGAFIVNTVSTLGIQAYKTMQAMGAAKMAGAVNMTAGLIPGGGEASKQATQAARNAETDMIGSMVGGFYGDLRSQGVSVKTAKAASSAMLVAQNALNLLPIKGLGVGLDALGEAFLKTESKGILTKIAVEAGKSYATQGAIAIINGAISETIPELAVQLDKRVQSGKISRDDAIAILGQFAKDIPDMAKKAGPGVLMQTLVFGTLGAGAAAFKGARVEIDAKKIADEIDKTVEPLPNANVGGKAASSGKEGEVPSMRLAEEAKAKAAQAKAERDAKATVAAMPAEALDKPIPFEDVPRGTEKPAPDTGEKPFTRTPQERINDLATLEKNKVISEPQQAELSKLREEAKPIDLQVAEDPRVVKAKEGAPALQKALDEEMAKPEPDSMRVKALQDTLDADAHRVSHIENQVYQEKFTEQHPEVVAARQALEAAKMDPTQTDKVDSLTEALDSARKEAKKMAAIRGATRVASERARVDRLETKHKAIDLLKSVDPATFDKASGDTIRQIQEHFAKPEKPSTGGKPETQVLDLDALKGALADAKAAHEDIAPEIEDALSKMPSTYAKLSPEHLQGLVAVVKNLQKIRSLEGKIRTGEGWVKMADLQADAEKSIKPPKGSIFGKQVAKGKRRTTAAVRTQVNGFSMNGEIVMGGEGTAVHKAAIQDVLNSRRDYILERELQEKAARTLLKDRIKIDQQKNPVGWNDYWNKKFTEDGVTLTRAEIMDNYMGFQDENHRESLLDDGTVYSSHVMDEGNPADVEILPESTYQKFFSHLGKNEHDLMNIAIKGEAERGQALSDYHERQYGTPIEVVPNHWRKYVKREGVTYEQDIIDIQKENQHIRINTDEKSLISRTGAKGATYTTGFWDKFTSSINDAALITKMGEAVHNSSRVLNDGKISDKIAKTYGGSILKQLREDLAVEAGQRETPKELERTADALGNIASNVHLGAIASLKVPIKLAGLGFRSLTNNPHGFIPGTIETLTHYKAASAAAREFSSLTAEAYKSGGSIDLQQLSQQSAKAGKARAIGKKAQNINMAGTRGGSNIGFTWDATTSRHEAEYQFNRALKGKEMDSHFKAVTQVTEDMVKRGLTPEQKMNAVGRYADSAIGESHAVADPGYKLGLQKTGLGRIITKFKSEPLKGFEQVRRLGMRFAREPSMVNAGKLFTSLVVYGAVEGLLIYGINEGVNALFGTKSKQTWGETERATVLAMIPMVGDAINEHLYLAQHPWVGDQQGAVESLAVLPLNMILDTAIMYTPGYTPSQKRAASKRVAYALKSIFNTPISLGARSEQ